MFSSFTSYQLYIKQSRRESSTQKSFEFSTGTSRELSSTNCCFRALRSIQVTPRRMKTIMSHFIRFHVEVVTVTTSNFFETCQIITLRTKALSKGTTRSRIGVSYRYKNECMTVLMGNMDEIIEKSNGLCPLFAHLCK